MQFATFFLTALVSCGFFAAVLLAVFKFFCETTGLGSRFRFAAGAGEWSESGSVQRIPYGKLILFALGVRLLVFVAGVFICLIFQSPEHFNLEAFSRLWHKWDSTGYTNMAKVGYSFLENGENILLVFFPLYSFCMRLTAGVLQDYYVSGLVVSYLFYIGSVIYLYKLVLLDFDENIAWKTVVLISVFPFSFFFGSIHTESITLFMMTMTFYHIRKHNWPLVMVFGALSGLCRMVGSLVAIPAAMEYIRVYKPFSALRRKEYKAFWKNIFTKFIFIPLIGIGGGIYLLINYLVSGNAFKFLEYQNMIWYNETQFITKTIYDLFNRIFTGFNTIAGCVWIPELLILIFAVFLMIRLWKRLPSIYTVFLSAYILVSYAASWLLSGSRYMAIAIPFFILLGIWTSEKQERYLWTVVISAVFLGIYLTAFLTNQQVM